MRAAVFSVTGRGAELSGRIAEILSPEYRVTRFCFHKYAAGDVSGFSSLSDTVAEVFQSFDALIFVCACGIAVRAVAPNLHSKQSDPAVVVLDDCGKYAISLLSGHLGGANRLAESIAEAVGAQPVITTATDSGGRFSPDCFALANGLFFDDLSAAKEIAAAVLRGEKIGLYSEFECVNLPPEISRDDNGKYGLCISREMSAKPFGVTFNLAPKNIVLGVGCKKGAEYSALMALMERKLTAAQIRRISMISTIDRKSEESCILRLCEELKAPLKTYTAEQLAAVPGEFTGSDFVARTVGVDSVCERSAAAGGNTLILGKTAADGVTIAAAERNVLIDFSRKQK